ncbi:hypothetical protein GCM10011297_10370 [Bacterioplanes sanyensis]|uniref:amidohydrolase family protein n=1 Tax=Bacterioplanes sanyensis TaxID=1249553 RepID=UPI00167C3173|nr:amidohydrolase family protein [Bacterioplanes sanyensis]GGY39094.1 hypothetical protein GCM10011297_10370 [Bacterioplanes sanyensis]
MQINCMHYAAMTAILTATLSACTTKTTSNASYVTSNNFCASSQPGQTLFYNGTILTMADSTADMLGNYSAMLVNGEQIVSVGVDSMFAECKSNHNVKKVNLKGKALMPGFIEPHMHLTQMVDYSAIADLSPCLPELYYYRLYDQEGVPSLCDYGNSTSTVTGLAWTKSRLQDWLDQNPLSPWVIGNGIDPARFGNTSDALKSAAALRNNPAQIIDEELLPRKADGKPVFLLDQSGHVGYVNGAAFVAAGICSKWPCGPKINLNPGVTLPQDKTPALGTWQVHEGLFTGLLLEEPAYSNFLVKIGKDLKTGKDSPFFFLTLDDGFKATAPIVKKIAASGVTTVINGGGFSVSEIMYLHDLAYQNGNADSLLDTSDMPALRYRTLMASTIQDQSRADQSPVKTVTQLEQQGIASRTNTWPTPNNESMPTGIFAANGIKVWADGSTQGCSGFLAENYATDGVCDGKEGYLGSNYSNSTSKPLKRPEQSLKPGDEPFQGDGSLYQTMLPFWHDGWMLQVHANGDDSMISTANSMAYLQQQQANTNPMVLIHATVAGNPSTPEKATPAALNAVGLAKLRGVNLSTSHLTGHVAYWGGAFSSILDGHATIDINKQDHSRLPYLDAYTLEQAMGIDFSLHSDAPIAPVNPLWYVEHMRILNNINGKKGRATWIYPDLDTKQATALPTEGAASGPAEIYQLLKAITLTPAQQNRLDDHIGSIKPGKTADLVILCKNPLEAGKDIGDIASIGVHSSYVGGKPAHHEGTCL